MSSNIDYPLEETVHILFTTRAFATGIPGTLSAATVAIYEDGTATPIMTGVLVTEDLNSITGLNMVPIVATAANGFNTGASYHVVIEAGTVDSVSVVGEVVGSFSVARSTAAVDLANGTDGLGAIKAETALIVADTNELQTDNIPGAISGLNNVAATDIVSSGAINTLAGAVVNVDLVDTCTTNTDVRGTDGANTTVPDAAGVAPTATEIVDEWETQSQADPTGFHVNIKEINGTNQTANDNGADINTLVGRGDAHLLIGNSGVGLTHLALASINTEIRLAELDSANIPSDIDAIPTTAMRGTDGVDTSTMRGTDGVDTSTMRGTDSALLAANVPTNFSSLGIEADGDITKVNLVDANTDMRGTDGVDTSTMRGTDGAALASDYTSARAGYLDNVNGHTAQTGDSYSRIGNAGVGLTHLATSANLATVDTIVDSILAMLDDPRSEPGQGAPSVNADAMTKLDYLYKFMRNKVITGTTSIDIYDDAGTTIDHLSTISAVGNTFTRGEFITGA